jgi:hypothetical protein
VAGAPHGVARGSRGAGGRDGWVTNKLSIGPIHDAAVRRLYEWTSGGPPAPYQPRVEVADGRPPQIRRDELGNAIGGIRLPELVVPTAEHRGMSFGTGRAPLFGASRPFSPERLTEMYPTRKDFVERWRRAVDALVDSGALLGEDAPEMRSRGDTVALPIDP